MIVQDIFEVANVKDEDGHINYDKYTEDELRKAHRALAVKLESMAKAKGKHSSDVDTKWFNPTDARSWYEITNALKDINRKHQDQDDKDYNDAQDSNAEMAADQAIDNHKDQQLRSKNNR